MKTTLFGFILICVFSGCAPTGSNSRLGKVPYDSITAQITSVGLSDARSYAMLEDLIETAGTRLSGSPGAEKAIRWSVEKMQEIGFDSVWLESVMVPRWIRGNVEDVRVISHKSGSRAPLKVTALGGTIGTPPTGIEAGVVEVHSFEELRAMGDAAKGKFVFFNRPMDDSKFYPGEAYGGAVEQRTWGAFEASCAGGVGALVRSMTMKIDDYPHTGAMRYNDSVPRVPSAALSTIAANELSRLLKEDPQMKIRLVLSCDTLPDVESANVVAEFRGSKYPDEVVLIGGHLDSWDIGQGAHDDGAGVVECLEAVRLLKTLGLRPQRTIRVVLFMNEENGLRGARAYAAVKRPSTKHIASIETDAGGFSPRAFSTDCDSLTFIQLKKFDWVLAPIDMAVVHGHSGADIGPLKKSYGVPTIGLRPDYHRYFDHHHSDTDILQNVHPRELQMGAIAMAAFAYALADAGLQ